MMTKILADFQICISVTLNNNKIWFENISWLTSEKPNMALSGVCEGSFKFPLKNSLTLAQRILVFVQSVKRWAVASSSRLQKEHLSFSISSNWLF